MAFFSIDKSLLPMKAHYFLFNAGTAPIVPFLPVYARQLGLSSFVVGNVYAVLPFFGMLSKPLFGALADHFKIQKLLFLFFQLLSALALFTIQYVPEVPTKTPVQFHCYQESSLVACDSIEPDAVGEVLKESMANGSTLCDVQCEINRNSSFYSDLCHGWRLSQYCPTSNSSTVFSGFPSDIPGPSILEMTVEIPLKHYLKEGNCSYFRVHNAIFSDKSPVVPYCEEFQTSECSALCDNAAVMDLITKPIDDNYSPAESHQFWIFVLLLVVAWSSMAVVTSVGDAICFGMLGERPTHYGRQRLWGAVGWGLFTLITGLLLDELSKNQVKKNYSIAFYIVVVNILLSIIVSYKLQYNQTRISSNIFVNMWSLVSQPRILVFIAWCIVVGMNTAILWQFLFWHLEDLAGSDRKWIKALEGLASAVQCVGGELPLFFLSGWIIKRLGHIHVMTLVLLSFGIRFLLYSVLSNPWLCLPIELFQGVTFGLCYATMTSYASILAAPGTETTVQGLVGAVFEGVGAGLGSLIGGYLTFVSSGSTMFGIFGGISIVLAILHAVAQYFLSRTPIAPAAGKAFQTVKYSAPSDNEGCEEEEVLS